VEAIGAQRANAQTEVNFGEGSNRDRHGMTILTTEETEETEKTEI